MTAESEPEDFTWQTLYEYIERRIAGVLKALQFVKEDPRLTNVDETYSMRFERELKMLRQCLALVIEMQSRESLQELCPILSLNIIRLRCRHQHAEQDDSLEFAWISLIGEGRYSLQRMGINESQEPTRPDSFDADLLKIVEQVEKLVKEICIGEHQ
jgi:hypothetical protein